MALMRLFRLSLFAALAALLIPPQSARADLRAMPGMAEQMGRSGEATGTGAELAFVMEIFSEIQPRSIAINAEIIVISPS